MEGPGGLSPRRLPHAEFKIVAEVGHYYPLERPHDFNEHLRTFLSQIGG